ncbi:MAG: hypothetical protein QXQ40_01905 [Candidatus Aenigmatarchaeota archaeon]
MLNQDEYIVLKKISERHIITKQELVSIFKKENPIINKIAKSLLEKGYITAFSFGQAYLIITNEGFKALEDYEK